MDFSQVGRFGTLSLMKRQEPDTVVTAFGIDTDQLTFGRDPKCSVRLYYSDINLVHCKIIFQERKAFLIVLGPAGLLVDGCRVYPNASPGGKQTTIPLSNNSEIEIHGKRFRFSYPPKEIRATLFATPAPLNRKLRLSMIQSAQVFSPAPSQDPRENLRILRSPMKNTFQSPRKPSQFSQSPITATRHNGVIEEQDENEEEEEEEEEEGEDIVLVDGPHPRVVQEEKDLIILEEVDEPVPQPTIQIQPPKTPQRRRSQSLHRAVLIRSAQRAVIEHERQQQEEEEEREEELEVVDTITNADVSSDESPGGTPQTYRSGPSSDEETDSDRDQAPEDTNPDRRKSLWRKSIERIWPFRNSTTEESEDNKDEEAEQEEESSGEESEDYERDEGQDEPEALPSLPQATPIRRHLGSFMTPQIGNKPVPFDRGESVDSSRGRLAGGPPVRYSLGGDARRVPFDSAWRVKDIVVPVKGGQQESTLPEPSTAASPQRPPPQTSPVRSRPEITAEERKAIQERRRSALREVDSRAYFTDGIPGMSPSKATSSTSPAKPGFNDFNNPFRPAGGSPTKGESVSPVKDVVGRLSSTDEEDEKMDTRSLLERMKETVEGMKRRRSTVGVASTPSPIKSSVGSNPFEGGGFEHFTLNSLEIQDDDDDDDDEHDDDDDDDDEHEHEHDEDEDEDKENDRNAMDVDEPMVVLRSPNKNQPIPLSPLEAAEEPVVEVSPIVAQDPTVLESPPQLEEVEQPPVQRSNQLQVPLTRGRSRTKSPQPIVETMALEEPAEAPTVETERRRDTRKSTTPPDQEEAPPVAPTETRSEVRRLRKPTTGEVDKPQTSRRGRPKTPTVDEVPAAAPKRTSKRAVVVKEEVADVPVVPAPTRRGRPPAVSKIATRQKSGDRAKRPTSRARSGAKTPVDVDDGDDDNDPLDSIVASEQTNVVEEPAVFAKSTTATRGRKPRSGLKKEDSADVLKTSTRARTTVTASTASKTPATRGPGRPRKTPATAPPAITRAMDKENTPEEGDSSSKSAAATDEGVVVKVRTTTTRKTRTAAVKQEAELEGSSGGGGGGGARPKTRGTRTMTRTRTKTT